VKTLILLAAVSLPFYTAVNINFDSMKLGQLPPGWSPADQHPGAGANWIIKPDPTAPSRPNVLAPSHSMLPHLPLCLFDRVTFLDGDISVKMKILSGKDGQDAGVVFRASDPNNYYLVRASARDHNIMMFRVKDGHAEAIRVNGSRMGSWSVVHPIKIGDWNLLRVTYKGNQTTVYFNHRKVFDARDGTLTSAGRVGVWTNAETLAHFDDFRFDKKK
jgi:hypothetical protein